MAWSYLFLFAVFLLIPQLAWAQKFDERWMLCRADSDCVIIPGVCGEEMVVNRMSVKPYMDYKQAMLGLHIQCNPNIPHYAVKPRCVEGECAYDLPFDVP